MDGKIECRARLAIDSNGDYCIIGWGGKDGECKGNAKEVEVRASEAVAGLPETSASHIVYVASLYVEPPAAVGPKVDGTVEPASKPEKVTKC